MKKTPFILLIVSILILISGIGIFTNAQMSGGPIPWNFVYNYPAACSDGYAITQLNDSVTCEYKGNWDGTDLNMDNNKIQNIYSINGFTFALENDTADLREKMALCTGGGKIHISGTYYIDEDLIFTSRGCELIGNGQVKTSIVAQSNFTGSNMLNLIEEAQSVKDISFDANNVDAVQTVIYNNMSASNIDNVKISNFKHIGIHLAEGSYYSEIKDVDNYFTTKWDNTISVLMNSNNNRITGGHLQADYIVVFNGTIGDANILINTALEGGRSEFTHSKALSFFNNVQDTTLIGVRCEDVKDCLYVTNTSVGHVYAVGLLRTNIDNLVNDTVGWTDGKFHDLYRDATYFLGGNVSIGTNGQDGLSVGVQVTETSTGSDHVRIGNKGGRASVFLDTDSGDNWGIANNAGTLWLYRPFGNVYSFTTSLLTLPDKLKITNLTGTGNDYVCVDASGLLFRSNTAC